MNFPFATEWTRTPSAMSAIADRALALTIGPVVCVIAQGHASNLSITQHSTVVTSPFHSSSDLPVPALVTCNPVTPVKFDSGDHSKPDDRIPPITRRMITHIPLGACSARWGQCSSPRPAKPVMKWRAFCFGRRPTKLGFHEHRVTCPYCRSNVTVVSLMEWLVVARRTCPACKREFYGQA